MKNYLGYVETFYPLKVLKYLRENFEALILSYSGGMDSTLLLLYALRYDIEWDHIIFINTKLEAPETFRYIKAVKDALG